MVEPQYYNNRMDDYTREPQVVLFMGAPSSNVRWSPTLLRSSAIPELYELEAFMMHFMIPTKVVLLTLAMKSGLNQLPESTNYNPRIAKNINLLPRNM